MVFLIALLRKKCPEGAEAAFPVAVSMPSALMDKQRWEINYPVDFRASPHLYFAALLIIMRRTTPFEPLEPIEPAPPSFANNQGTARPRETLIKSLSDFILGFLYRARRQRAQIASYLRRMSTTLCIKTHMKSDSAIESAFP